MKYQLHEIVNVKVAKEKTFYVFEGIVYQYGKVKNLKHEDRFFRVCKADNIEVKLAEDLKDGWTIVNLDVNIINDAKPIDVENSILDIGTTTFEVKIK